MVYCLLCCGSNVPMSIKMHKHHFYLMEVWIKTLTGASLQLLVSPYDSVFNVKFRIQKLEGVLHFCCVYFLLIVFKLASERVIILLHFVVTAYFHLSTCTFKYLVAAMFTYYLILSV